MSKETKITIIGFLTMFIVGVSDLIVVGILLPMSKAFHVSPALMGQLVTIYACAFAVLSPLLTKWTRKWADKYTLVGSILIFILVTFLTIWVRSFAMLCVLRVILAGSASLITVKLMAIGAKICVPEKKAKVVANIYVGFSAANILGIPLGMLLANYFDWSVPFYLICCIALLCLAMIHFGINKMAFETVQNNQGDYHVLSKKGVIIILLFLFLMMVSTSLLFTYVEPLIRQGGHSLSVVSIALFISGVAGVIGSKLGNLLAEKYGYVLSGTIITVVYSVSLLGLLLGSGNVTIVLLCILLWNLFHWGTNPTVQYALLQFVKGDPSQLFSYNIAILNLGIGIGSLLGGMLFAMDNEFTYSLLVAIGLSGISFILLQSLRRIEVH
ncbi:MFS transporter [Lysinibacillus sp. NPDC048646]|uniref:MFS transporter n=1 Tax=Lysinibacillus sp. NPDC048646 TaxID=3390574 RepID=UPI003CFF2D72